MFMNSQITTELQARTSQLNQPQAQETPDAAQEALPTTNKHRIAKMEYIGKPWGNHRKTWENNGIHRIHRKTIGEPFGKHMKTIKKTATLNCVLCVQNGWGCFSKLITS